MIASKLLYRQTRGWSAIFLMSITSSILLVIVVSTYSRATSINRMANRTLDYKAALAMAEAGAERGMAELNRS